MNGEFYSVNEVSVILGYSYNTIKNWISKGLLVPDRISPSGRKQFKKETVEKFKKDMEVKSNADE